MAGTKTDETKRLAALARTALLDSAPEQSFDRLTATLARVLAVPVSLVSLVDENRQFFKSSFGLTGALANIRETPLTHSFCKQLVECEQPLVINDAREHPTLKENPAISEFNVVAYLGYPITVEGSFIIGSLAAIDSKPRHWSDDERATVGDFADILSTEIELRTRIAGEGGYMQELRTSRAQLKRILDSAGEGIYGIDQQGRCTFSNQSCADLLGYSSPSELLGQQMHRLIHHTRPDGSPYPQDECRIHVAAMQGQPVHVEDEVLWDKDGDPFHAEYRSYPIEENGELLGAVVTFSNISERLRAQQQMLEALESAKEADRQKTQFLANMSHEIRTPMNAILGFSELMEGVIVSDKAKEYLGVIRESGESLLELINDILDLSKIEAGRIDLQIEAVDTTELIQSVVALVAPAASEKDLELSVNIDASLPKYFLLDRLRVRQIILNLISNAVKFTETGGVSVQMSGVQNPEDERRMDLIITVTDSGPGISEQQQKKIFLPFHQIAVNDESEHSGTGLGLSISRNLAKLMHGEISVRSTIGKGSAFSVILHNLDIASRDAAANQAPVVTEDNLNLIQKSRILVADDNSVNRHLISEMFAETHHEILLAQDGAEAVQKAREQEPDLVLMDIRMPKIDGRKALQMLRDDDKLPESLPVVAVTASSLLNKEKALREAFDGYLRKPFSRAQLFRELARRLPVVEQDAEPVPTSTDAESSAGEPRKVERGSSAQIPEHRKEDWMRLIDELLQLQNSAWRNASDTLTVQTVIEFARNLKRLAKASDCESLHDYATELHSLAENFQLSRLQRHLAQFPQMIENLKQAVDNSV